MELPFSCDDEHVGGLNNSLLLSALGPLSLEGSNIHRDHSHIISSCQGQQRMAHLQSVLKKLAPFNGALQNVITRNTFAKLTLTTGKNVVISTWRYMNKKRRRRHDAKHESSPPKPSSTMTGHRLRTSWEFHDRFLYFYVRCMGQLII